jgi:hypothetical protein
MPSPGHSDFSESTVISAETWSAKNDDNKKRQTVVITAENDPDRYFIA